MTTAINTHNMTDLAVILAEINNTLSLEATNREDWIQIKLNLCRLFHKARFELKTNSKFGEWFAANFPDMNIQDRAAYVGMGEDIDRAEYVLRNTMRSSMQHIFDKEFKKAKPRTKGKNKGKTQEQAKAEAKATAAAKVEPVFTFEEYTFLLKMVRPERKELPSVEDLTRASQLLNDHKAKLCQKRVTQPKGEKAPAQEPARAAA